MLPLENHPSPTLGLLQPQLQDWTHDPCLTNESAAHPGHSDWLGMVT